PLRELQFGADRSDRLDCGAQVERGGAHLVSDLLPHLLLAALERPQCGLGLLDLAAQPAAGIYRKDEADACRQQLAREDIRESGIAAAKDHREGGMELAAGELEALRRS